MFSSSWMAWNILGPEMDTFHSYEGTGPLYCILAAPFDTNLVFDRTEARRRPHHRTT